MPIKSYKYRLSPTHKQIEKLQWTLDHCRELYNAALQERKDAYTVFKAHPNYYDEQWRKEHMKEYTCTYYTQAAQLPDIKQVREDCKEVYAQVQQEVLRRVEKTYQAFFARVKRGDTPGYPRFKGRGRYDSFTYPQAGFSLTLDNRVSLAKISSIKVKLHRPIEGKVKTCTVKREGDAWYVVFTCEVEQVHRSPYTDEAVGIDLGLLHFATLSTGDTIENPRYYRKSEKKLKAAQQSLARKKKGSNRRKKAVKRVARCHRKVRNQRKDFLHKQSRQLVNTYTTIVFEDLQVATISKRPKPKQDEEGKYLPNGASAKGGLNKSILDAGWSEFVNMCRYKAEEAGTVQVLQVNPKYTSQVCSSCGTVRKKTLDERWHSCECGCSLDRDHNAAINILRLGLNQREAISVNAASA